MRHAPTVSDRVPRDPPLDLVMNDLPAAMERVRAEVERLRGCAAG
jgi:hypothetical protein